jgi:hypothetical protein
MFLIFKSITDSSPSVAEAGKNNDYPEGIYEKVKFLR